MRITIIGGSGLIGSKTVRKLRDMGHEALSASLESGVNTITGEGLANAVRGADVVVDVSNSPSFDDAPALRFFVTSTENLLAAEQNAGVRHHVALSVVGTDRLQVSGYFRAKMAQETLIKASPIPYTIIHATQFFEFVPRIADQSSDGVEVRLPPVFIRPMAADDVAEAVAEVAVGTPRNGIVEIAGPEQYRLDDLVRHVLSARHDARVVVTNPHAMYYGIADMNECALVPNDDARFFGTRLDDWLDRTAAVKA